MVLIGIDVGTTGTRTIAINEGGDVVAAATAEYSLLTPKPGWAEQNPADWWRATQETLRTVAAQVGREEIAGLGLTGQMHGSVFLDAQGDVIRPALLWNDQRTESQCDEITQRVGQERLLRIACNPALTGFQAPKILWLRQEEPDAYNQVAHVLLPKDDIRYRLTGEMATDASDAAGTLLLDVGQRDWSHEILDALEIPQEWLPQVFEGPEVTGRVKDDVADDLGLPRGLPVVAGGGDNAAAAVGNGIVQEGLLSCSIGTSGVLFAHTDTLKVDPAGRLHAFCHAVPDRWHLMGVTLSAGGSFRWHRDVLGGEEKAEAEAQGVDAYDLLTQAAATASLGSEGLLFLPYLTGERTPHLDANARGAFVGLTVRHTKAHLTRAVMEGVTFSLRDSLTLMQQLGLEIQQIRATGGGARSPFWRQMQADVLGSPVTEMAVTEGPAYGAAILAGVGAGIYSDVPAACQQVIRTSGVTEPDPQAAARYDDYYQEYARLYDALKDSMRSLSALAAGEA